MKLLITSLFLIFFMVQDFEIFDAVVTETSKTHITVVWEDGSLRIRKEDWGNGSYRFWPKEVSKGYLLKATYLVGRLRSVPGCEERLKEAIREHCEGLDCRAPTNSLNPEDCSRPTSKFTAELLEKMNRKDEP